MHRGGEGLINSHQQSAFPQGREDLENTHELSNYSNASNGKQQWPLRLSEVLPGAGQGREVVLEVDSHPAPWLRAAPKLPTSCFSSLPLPATLLFQLWRFCTFYTVSLPIFPILSCFQFRI